MDRWTGVLKLKLYPNTNALYRVAASLLLSSSPNNFAVPSRNVVFFCGDRVEGTGNPVIERLSDPQRIAEILVSKFGGSVNAYVVEASVFNGPFAVFKDFVPLVNENGEPRSYDATGFPASSSLVLLLSKFWDEARLVGVLCSYENFRSFAVIKLNSQGVYAIPAKEIILGKQSFQYDASATFSHKPQTSLLGFSKGGIILNQFLTELASLEDLYTEVSTQENKNMAIPGGFPYQTDEWIIPTSKECLLESIAEIHYVDVGLNVHGAYITAKEVIDGIAEYLTRRDSELRLLFHGTPRQWCHRNRTWIRKEKDELVRLLQNSARNSMGKLRFSERLYFPDKSPDLQMHFEIINQLDVSYME